MADAPKILVIEGDEALAEDLMARLEHKGFKPQLAKNRSQASVLLRSLRFDAVLSDVRLPDGDGEKMFQDALPFLRSTPIIFTAAAGDVNQAVRLVKAGAADYLQKPYDVPTLVERLQGMVARRQVFTRASWPEPTMVSPAMRDLGVLSERLAATNISALVTGESGSGKEVVVRHLHRHSSRAAEPFILVACAGLACVDGERLLFGELLRSSDDNRYELRTGALDEARCGTLFLDEIHEMPPAIQSRLVQVIDDRMFRRLGDVTSMPFEARILAASDLRSADLRERLRPDLFHRLAVVEIAVPPLRDRSADIEPLVESLLRDLASDPGMSVRPVDAAAMSAMRAYDWPGNVRELRNRLVRAVSFGMSSKIGIADLFPDIRASDTLRSPRATLEETRSNAERQRIVEALATHNGRIADTARSLGISRVTLWGKMKRFGLSDCA
jgi:DNA-binding NtrC family response regulator